MISVSVPSEFFELLTLKRYEAGSYVDGKWVDGAVTETTILASIQPLTAGDYRLLPEGNSSQRGWKVFWNGDFQFGKDGSLKPDEILVEGIWFNMAAKPDAWIRHGHSAALFTEIK